MEEDDFSSTLALPTLADYPRRVEPDRHISTSARMRAIRTCHAEALETVIHDAAYVAKLSGKALEALTSNYGEKPGIVLEGAKAHTNVMLNLMRIMETATQQVSALSDNRKQRSVVFYAPDNGRYTQPETEDNDDTST